MIFDDNNNPWIPGEEGELPLVRLLLAATNTWENDLKEGKIILVHGLREKMAPYFGACVEAEYHRGRICVEQSCSPHDNQETQYQAGKGQGQDTFHRHAPASSNQVPSTNNDIKF
jgi:hypothetical protein